MKLKVSEELIDSIYKAPYSNFKLERCKFLSKFLLTFSKILKSTIFLQEFNSNSNVYNYLQICIKKKIIPIGNFATWKNLYWEREAALPLHNFSCTVAWRLSGKRETEMEVAAGIKRLSVHVLAALASWKGWICREEKFIAFSIGLSSRSESKFVVFEADRWESRHPVQRYCYLRWNAGANNHIRC